MPSFMPILFNMVGYKEQITTAMIKQSSIFQRTFIVNHFCYWLPSRQCSCSKKYLSFFFFYLILVNLPGEKKSIQNKSYILKILCVKMAENRSKTLTLGLYFSKYWYTFSTVYQPSAGYLKSENSQKTF